MRKELLVLAKSFKPHGRCVAGLEVVRSDRNQPRLTNRWIRPVTCASSADSSGAVPHEWCDGFGVLDVIEVDAEPVNDTVGQPENIAIGSAPIRTLPNSTPPQALCDIARQALIWQPSNTQRPGQIRARDTENCDFSLTLVQPAGLQFHLCRTEPYGQRDKKIYASFYHGGQLYSSIPVTDPAICRIFSRQFPPLVNQQRHVTLNHGDRYFLLLSLTPEWKDGYRYMLGAAVIDHTGYINGAYR